MRTWLFMLSGLLIWTAHFFGIYIAASLFPGTNIAKWLTAAFTLIALGLVAMVMWAVLRSSEGDPLRGWLDRVVLLGGALSAVAILYQGLPAVII